MGAGIPKQYLPLAGRTVIEHTLGCFSDHPSVRGIVVALAADDCHWPKLDLRGYKPVETVIGGCERSRSVLNTLDYLVSVAAPDDWVLVHDAARPNLKRADLDKLIGTVADDPAGGILAAPVRDTMKQAGVTGCIETTIDRSCLWHAFTPQMFRLQMLRDALVAAAANGKHVTDEASAMEIAGFVPRLVQGSVENIKITRPDDLRLAEFYLSERK